jgi:hypothetical protein
MNKLNKIIIVLAGLFISNGLSAQTTYQMKMPISPIVSNSVFSAPAAVPVYDGDAWVAFFNQYCGTSFLTPSDYETSAYFLCPELNDGVMPNSLIGDRIGGFSSLDGTFTNTDFFSGLKEIRGAFTITDNHSLTNIDGFSSVTSASSSTYIKENNNLENLDGLSSLTSVNGHLHIDRNLKLTNLNGLSSLTYVRNNIYMGNLPLLDDISGLNNLGSVQTIVISNREYTTKLNASSYLCTSNELPTPKSNFCNP